MKLRSITWLMAAGMMLPSCKKRTDDSDTKTIIRGINNLPANVNLGRGYKSTANIGFANNNCTNIDPNNSEHVLDESDVFMDHQITMQSSDYDSFYNSHSGTVVVGFGDASATAGGSTAAEGASSAATMDTTIFIARRVRTVQDSYLGNVAVTPDFAANRAFSSNCGDEFVNQISYGGGLRMTMTVSAKTGKVDNTLETAIKTGPMPFLKNLSVETTSDSSWGSAAANHSIDLKFDTNIALTCMGEGQGSQGLSCDLANPKSCQAIVKKVDECGKEFRTKLQNMSVAEVAQLKPILISTQFYNESSDTAEYWRLQLAQMQQFKAILAIAEEEVDLGQSAMLNKVTNLMSEMQPALNRCNLLIADQLTGRLRPPSSCDRFQDPIIEIKSSQEYQRYMSRDDSEINILAPFVDAQNKVRGADEFNGPFYFFLKAGDPQLKISTRKLKNGTMNINVSRMNMDGLGRPINVDDSRSNLRDSNKKNLRHWGEYLVLNPPTTPKAMEIIVIKPTHKVRFGWRNSVCIYDGPDHLALRCENYRTGKMDHLILQVDFVN